MSTPTNPSDRHTRTNRLWLAFGGLMVAVLLGGVFTLGSLNAPFTPETRTEFVVLFALSTFNIVALFIFSLILIRSLFRLWAGRRSGQLGARFKTKMVLGAIGVSLLPLVFMFFVSYALMNRTLNKWFPRPLEIAIEESQKLLDELGRAEHARLQSIAAHAAAPHDDDKMLRGLAPDVARTRFAILQGADAAWLVDALGNPRAFLRAEEGPGVKNPASLPQKLRALPSGAELWQLEEQFFLTANWKAPEQESIVAARRMPPSFAVRYAGIETQTRAYAAQRQELRTFKNQILLTLALFTVLLMFSAMWFALFLSKQVTGPIQALAQGTEEVSRGNFGYQIDIPARDELGALVQSFNQMTRQLAESRQQLDEFTRSLQQAVSEIEERRKLMETILENIPTAVLSLDALGGITRVNQAAVRLFGEAARSSHTLADLAGTDAARSLEQQMRKALRMGTSSKELELVLPGNGGASAPRVLHAAVTVSALGTRRQNPGFVVVIDDLTELLRAQKAAAWQEVAQRIAHEIKNPLTPIQLSAQRLMRHLDRSTGAQATAREPELAALIGECAGLIEREVATLKSLVDEFSQFARFPTAKLSPLNANGLVASALDVFSGRLDGVTVRSQYQDGLPLIKADAELLRRVMVNLIDNAAEAMEGSTARELSIATRTGSNPDTIEIVVADSGHGISPEDRDKLFLPHFSTRNRGTGLGLAIASRIVAEHGGSIRVEDNSPVGARFVVRLPAMETQTIVKE